MIPILDGILKLVDKGLDFIPDPKMKADAKQKITEELDRHSEELLKSLTAVDIAQTQVNLEEAKSPSLFVSGWRPWIGWVCGAAFTWAFVLQPFSVFILAASGHKIDGLPVLNLSEMMPVLLGMLGLAGMRSWERTQGVARNSLNDK